MNKWYIGASLIPLTGVGYVSYSTLIGDGNGNATPGLSFSSLSTSKGADEMVPLSRVLDSLPNVDSLDNLPSEITNLIKTYAGNMPIPDLLAKFKNSDFAKRLLDNISLPISTVEALTSSLKKVPLDVPHSDEPNVDISLFTTTEPSVDVETPIPAVLPFEEFKPGEVVVNPALILPTSEPSTLILPQVDPSSVQIPFPAPVQIPIPASPSEPVTAQKPTSTTPPKAPEPTPPKEPESTGYVSCRYRMC